MSLWLFWVHPFAWVYLSLKRQDDPACNTCNADYIHPSMKYGDNCVYVQIYQSTFLSVSITLCLFRIPDFISWNQNLLLRILQATTLYSGHFASESLMLDVITFIIISGKWKVVLILRSSFHQKFCLDHNFSTRRFNCNKLTIAYGILSRIFGLIRSTSSFRILLLRVRRVITPLL